MTDAVRTPPSPEGLELTDGVVTLRPYQPRDVARLHEAAKESSEEAYRFLPWCHPEYQESDAISYVGTRDQAWETGEEYAFTVNDPETGRFLGGCGIMLTHRAHRIGEVGYWTRTSATQRGVASRAVNLLAPFGLVRLGLERLEILMAIENVGSMRVAEKAGAKKEGILRRRLRIHGKNQDAMLFALVRD